MRLWTMRRIMHWRWNIPLMNWERWRYIPELPTVRAVIM